jgi:hypothetical protein
MRNRIVTRYYLDVKPGDLLFQHGSWHEGRSMIQNKAPYYDEVLEELDEKSMVETVSARTGNVIKFCIDSNTYGIFRPPKFPNWYVDSISLQPTDSSYKMRYVE